MKNMQGSSSLYCGICGSYMFSHNSVLWEELITDWELSSKEVEYINRQQGSVCINCKNSFRSIALAGAIMKVSAYKGTFNKFITNWSARKKSVLEINEAGTLSPLLALLPRHKLVKFPEEDMTSLSFKDESYNLVLHSDTLEHIPDPILALKECRRVLKKGGACIYTVPIIYERMSRSRDGLKDSYHGNKEYDGFDYKVHTEFGADFWVYAIKAGFSNVTIHSFEFPSSLAIIAEK